METTSNATATTGEVITARVYEGLEATLAIVDGCLETLQNLRDFSDEYGEVEVRSIVTEVAKELHAAARPSVTCAVTIYG